MSSNDPFAQRPESEEQDHSHPHQAHVNDSFAHQPGDGSVYAPHQDHPLYGQPWVQPPTSYGYEGLSDLAGRPVPPPLASWGSRVLGRLLDMFVSWLPLIVCVIPGSILAARDMHETTNSLGERTTTDPNGFGIALIIIGFVAAIFTDFWNRGIRQGRVGQSIGKKIMRLSVIDENTGMPCGASAGAGRWFVEMAIDAVSACVFFLSTLDALWPLWDVKRQTLHDKTVHTVVIKAIPQSECS